MSVDVDRGATQIGVPRTGLHNRTLAAGRGTFVNDVRLPNMAFLAVLRSPHAHARIVSIDTSAAERLPGVVAVMTGSEAQASMSVIPEAFDTSDMGAKRVHWYVLAPDRVRFVGEAVAAVVAEDRYTACEARDLIEVVYDVLPAVVDPYTAMEEGAPLVEPEWGDNILITRDVRTGEPEVALEASPRRASGRVRSSRVTAVSIEPRGIVADYKDSGDYLTVWESTQSPHPLRTFLSEMLGMPEGHIHVIQPNVGGAFGMKQGPFQEEVLVAYLARQLHRPVKWIEERDENFQATGHARDLAFEYEVAFEDDGTITGLHVRIVADVGAPNAMLGWTMAIVTVYCLPKMYRIPNSRIQLVAVVTHKCPWNAYRGFGKDSASFLMDRVLDHVARETGISRVEVRLRNFIPPQLFPYAHPSGGVLDSGNYPEALRRVLATVDHDGFPALQAEARAAGRRIGLGVGMELTPEGCAIPGAMMELAYDCATVRIAPSGDVTVLTGVTSPGGGNETAMAQIAAECLGCDFSRVRVIQGDTELCPYGLGNYSSRSTMYGGSAVQRAAAELREKLLRVAGKMLEADAADLDAADDRIFVKGASTRSVTFGEVVDQVYRHPFGEFAEDEEPGLESTRYFRMGNIYHQPEKQGRFSNYPVWPYGAAACVVEVDPETGFVKVLRYSLVEDAGTIINPLLVDANLHGAITQGIGGALFEQLVYGDDGQLHTANLMDYTIPTAVEMPRFEIGHLETPSPFTPLGMKGVGESGVGAALGALCSAIENAFPELDLTIAELPLTPARVWRAIRTAERASAPVAADR